MKQEKSGKQKDQTKKQDEGRAQQRTQEPQTGGQSQEDGQKLYSQQEAQRMIDAALARKLQTMPSTDEIAAYKHWQQQHEQAEQQIAKRQQQLKQREQTQGYREAALRAGIHADYVEEAVLLAQHRAGDADGSVENTLRTLAAEHPSLGGDAPNICGGNPVMKAEGRASEPPLII